MAACSDLDDGVTEPTTRPSTRPPDARAAMSRVAVLAVAGSVLAVALVAMAGPLVSLVVLLVLTPLAIAARVDEREQRLPDRLVVLGAIPLGVGWVIETTVFGSDPLGSMGLGAVSLALPVLVLHLVSPASMGFGDVKFAVVLGAAIGMIEPRLSIWVLCLASGATAARGRRHGLSVVPFGPGLVGATLVCLSVASVVGVEAAPWR